MVWRPDGPAGTEARKIAPFIVPYTRGRGLDLGCGNDKAFSHFIGVDNGGVFGQGRGENVKSDIRDLSMFATDSMDFVFSSHALEDLEDTVGALTEWWRVIKPGGHLVLYLPHADFYPNVGQPGANPDHAHDFRPHDIIRAMRAVCDATETNAVMLENEERNGGNEYSFFQVYQKRKWPESEQLEAIRDRSWRRQKKSVLIVRYGGYGDMLLVSSILPSLKEDGWHITVNTTPRGLAPIEHDPHVDAWILQDNEQVPNHLLGEYWKALATRYDRFINLSESIEGALLAIPGRAQHGWPDELRRRISNVNYFERTHEIARVPAPFRPAFYPTEEERAWALEERAKAKGPLIINCLSGSSVHKTWPHLDALLARLLIETDATVALVGDEICRHLEQGWESEPRVWCRSGLWSIRQCLAIAQLADVVVAPETGILYAVAHDPKVRKVVLLSHSSPENLTKHWPNTMALASSVACWPCHRMHYGFEFCSRHEITGTAICAANIPVESVYEAITKAVPIVRPMPREAAE